MADELGHLSAEIALDINPFLNNQRVLEAQIKRTGNLLTQMEHSFKAAGSSIGSNSIFKTQIAQLKMLGKEVDNYRNKFEAAKKDLTANPTVDNERALGTTATNLQKTALQYDQVRLAAARTLQTQRATSSVFGQGSRMIGDYGNKLQSVASEIKGFGSGALTAGIGTGFIAAAHSAMTFKSEIQSIGPLLSDDGRISAQVSQELNQMSQSSLKWSQQYGISTTQINNAMTELVRRGFTAKQTLGSMPAILNASRASGEELGTVMQATASSIEMFGLKANTTSQQIKNTNRVTDVLTVAANKTASSFADISAAMTYVGPTAAQAHMSIEQVAAALGALSNKGIEASTAGTTLRQVLSKLTTDTPTNRKNMQAIGVDIDEIKKKGVDLPKLIDQINNKLKDKTPTEKMALLNAAFGKLGQGVMALFEKSNKSSKSAGQELQNLQDELEKAGGTTKRIADQMNNTPEAKWQRFLQTLKATAIEVGGNVLPAFEGLLKPIQNLAQAFGKLPASEQQAIVSMLAFTAAIKPLSSLVAAPISGLGKLENAFKKVYDFGAKLSGGLLKSAIADVDKLAGTASKAESTASSFEKLGSAALSAGSNVKGAAQGFSAIGQEVGGLSGMMTSAETAIAGVGTAGTEAAAGSATLATSLGATAAGLSIVAGAAVIATGAFFAIKDGVIPAIKALHEHIHEVNTWGSDISDKTSHAADNFKSFSDKATSAMDAAKDGVHTNAKSIKDDFDGMAKSAEKNADKTDKDLRKLAKELGGSAGAAVEQDRKDTKDKNSGYLKNIKSDQKLADQILNTAAKQGGKISDDSRVYLDNIQSDMAGNFVKTLNVSKSTAKAMQESLAGTFNRKLNFFDYKKVLDGFGQALSKEQVATNKHIRDLKAAYDAGELSYSQYIDAKEKLTDDSREKIEATAKGEVAFMRSQGKTWAQISSKLAAQGLSEGEIDEVIERYKKGAKALESALADTTGNISKDAKKAGEAWNKLVFDPKTGKIKTNAPEAIAEMAKTDKGWKQLKFIEKNAKLNVKGKELLAEGIVEAGKWNKLDLDEQIAFMKTKGMKDLGEALGMEDQWNNMDPKIVDLMVKASGKKQLLESLTDINNWNRLKTEQKQIIISQFSGFDKLRLEMMNVKEWNALPQKQKNFVMKMAGKGELEEALKKVGVWNALPDSMRKQIEAIDNASPRVKTAQAGLDKLNKTKASPQVKLESSSATNKLQVTQRLMDGLNGKVSVSNWVLTNQPGKKNLDDATNGLNKVNGKVATSTLQVNGTNAVQNATKAQNILNGTPGTNKQSTMGVTGAGQVQDGTNKQRAFNSTGSSSKNNSMHTSGRGEVQDGTTKQRNWNSTSSSNKYNHAKTTGRSEVEKATHAQQNWMQTVGHNITNTIKTVYETVKKTVTGKKTGTAGAWRSVPHFANGSPNDGWEGGPVIVGDGHRREVVSDPELGLFTTPATDTLMNLNRGAVIWRSVEAFQNAMWHAGIKDYPHFANGTTDQSVVSIADKIPDNTEDIVNALSNKKSPQSSSNNFNETQKETNELIATLIEQNAMLVQLFQNMGMSLNIDGKQLAKAQVSNNSNALSDFVKRTGMGFS